MGIKDEESINEVTEDVSLGVTSGREDSLATYGSAGGGNQYTESSHGALEVHVVSNGMNDEGRTSSLERSSPSSSDLSPVSVGPSVDAALVYNEERCLDKRERSSDADGRKERQNGVEQQLLVDSSPGPGSEEVSGGLKMSLCIIRPGEDDESPVKMTKSECGETPKGNCSSGSRDDNHGRGREPMTRKKTFGFGLNKFNLRMFTRSSRSTERLEEPLMNNQLHNHPSLHPHTSLLASSVSKSSSESNIPMCHNSLDNLTDDLPSSRSTDSSCLLPAPPMAPIDNNEGAQIDTTSGDCQEINQSQKDDHQSVQPDESVRRESAVGSNDAGPSCNSNSSSSGYCESRRKPFFHYTPNPSSFGQKFKLLNEGDVQVCKVKHGNNLMDKFIGSKLLRRWETHHISLEESCLTSKTTTGAFTNPIQYWQMEEIYVCVRLDSISKSRYVLRIVLPDGSLLLQGSNAYVRDQWYYSILWKKNIHKYQTLMQSSTRPEVIIKELKALVDFATTTPLQDDCVSHVPIEIVSNLLESVGDSIGKNEAEEILVALSPLLERSHPPPSLCQFFSRQCRTRPRCPLVGQLFTPVVRRALKHNVDFGKYPYMRRFIQDFIQALNCHNDGVNMVRNFVKSIHGPASSCPHPRVLSNLVSLCLAATFQIFEKDSSTKPSIHTVDILKDIPYEEQLICYLAVLDTISEFEDWRPSFAQLLQPLPFPEDALSNSLFTRSLSSVIRRFGQDNRCNVHQMILGVRDTKGGWFQLYSPSSSACFDDGELWGLMLDRLLRCCHRRKVFLEELGGKLLGSCLLLALREHGAAQEALCLMLEWKIIQSDDQRAQIVTTLQSTPTGRANYLKLCSRELHLKELQQKGGPRKLTLPSRSTDKDLAKLLSCGSFGNLECLSLAFTQVTSACAEQLIKLPSLRYLNLWSTQFGDPGLLLISEHLPNLQVLNLCETPATDKGLLSLACMTSLKKLNLNSTSLSAPTLEILKMKLPELREIDVRYTDAW